MKHLRIYIAAILLAAAVLSLSGCSSEQSGGTAAQAADLMVGVSPNQISAKPADAAFTGNMAEFSIALFKESIKESASVGENTLVSPLSVMLALAMTANGADGETLAQMEHLLGSGIPIESLNEYLHGYAQRLPNADKSRLSIANSIWFRDDGESLSVRPDFLQRNADYYGASAFSSSFDSQTIRDINDWVNINTDGMIQQILDEINDELLFLINTVTFDAEWQNVYYQQDIREGEFTNISGAVEIADFMHSRESVYLDDGLATGFMKPYATGGCSFLALLPNVGVSLEEYIRSLSGEGFLETLGNAHRAIVVASMPKFEYEYEIEMINALKALGITNAFDEYTADFSRMATTELGNGNIYISKVLHKTFISLDELGTKAGAATMVATAPGSAPNPEEPKIVRLDRPFVYAIIDNATNLPIFIGMVVGV